MTYDEPAADPALDEQIAYYRARADEYDDWFLRRGRYDHGAEWNRRWSGEVGRPDEIGQMVAALNSALDKLAQMFAEVGRVSREMSVSADDLTSVSGSLPSSRASRRPSTASASSTT